MKKTVLIASAVIFIVGCTMIPMKTASQDSPPVKVVKPAPAAPKQVVMAPVPVTDSNSSTTTNSGPVVFSHEHEDTTYIWDPATNCFYYILNGKRVNMPTGWRH